MKNKPGPSKLSRWRRVFGVWQPEPLCRPQVPPKLSRLPALQRCTAVLCYSGLRFEYWISPGGGLRHWLRLNLGIALLIGIPALCVVPILTFVFGQFTSWSHCLVEIAQNVLQFLLLSWAVVTLVTALFCRRRKRFRK